MWWIALVASIGLVALMVLIASSRREIEVSEMSFDHVEGRRLEIDVDSGDVRVTGKDTQTVTSLCSTSFTLRRPSVETEETPDAIVIRGRTHPWIFGYARVDHEITVPTAMPVAVHSRDGTIHLSNLSGEVSISASKGLVLAEGITGEMRLRSAVSDLVGQRLGAKTIEAHSDSGAVDLECQTRPHHVDATSGSGSVELMLPPGRDPYNVDARSSAGTTHVAVAHDPEATSTIRLRTSAGSITVLESSAPTTA